MRTDRTITTFSLALLLGACGTRHDQPAALSDDLKQDLAAAAAPVGDLAGTPQRYQPMRFVSAVERTPGAASVKRAVISNEHRGKVAAGHRPGPAMTTESVGDPTIAMGAETAPEPVAVPEAPTAEAVVAVQQPTQETVNGPSQSPTGSGSDGAVGDHGSGGGWGGLIGGLIGAVVIRGGHGGVDKCDPRTDGRARPTVIDRPDFGIPVPTGQPTFPGSRRR